MKDYQDYKQYAYKKKEQTGVEMIDVTNQNCLSFTPYIYNACSANCRFCSEMLVRSGKLVVFDGVCEGYEKRLCEAFQYVSSQVAKQVSKRVKNNQIFLSISGKEPSESVEQLEQIANVVKQGDWQGVHRGILISERVMYTNLSGFVKKWERLIAAIQKLELTRVECSRHHFDENKNQNIVRFKQGETIWKNEVFSDVVVRLQQEVPVRMVCVLQKDGIEHIDDVKAYLKYAADLGVKDVVFRELAVIGDVVEQGNVAEYIEDHRVELMDILQELPEEEFKCKSILEGYYYFSFEYEYMNMKVSFEMSDYEEMIKYHKSDSLHKLILYPDGLLCKDWNMQQEVSMDEK